MLLQYGYNWVRAQSIVRIPRNKKLSIATTNNLAPGIAGMPAKTASGNRRNYEETSTIRPVATTR